MTGGLMLLSENCLLVPRVPFSQEKPVYRPHQQGRYMRRQRHIPKCQRSPRRERGRTHLNIRVSRLSPRLIKEASPDATQASKSVEK